MLGKTEMKIFVLGKTEFRIFMLGKTEMRFLMLGKTEMWISKFGKTKLRFFMPGKSELWKPGGVPLASLADVALVIIALAEIDRVASLVPRYCDLQSSRPSPPRVSIVPPYDLGGRVVGFVCSWREHALIFACLVGTDGLVSLKLVLVSACLEPLYHVGARVKLTLRPLS